MDKHIEEVKTTQLQIRIREDVKDDLKIAAGMKGLSTSGMILSLITKAVSEAKLENPALFGVEHIPPHRSRFDVYAEALDAPDFSESEWQLMETYFKDHVETWKRFQRERMTPEPERVLAPIVAHIGPGDLTKAEAQKMIDAVDIGEKRKRKTG